MPKTLMRVLGSERIRVGADSSTAGRLAILSPRNSGITELEKEKKMEELGGWTRRSAPTPSTRLPHSATIPLVRPTIIKTKTTWIAIARMLSPQRSGRAARFPQNMRKREKGPSKESGIEKLR